ncbi:hypothetical protein M3Y97_00416500 [Aphelenchoides bicaudatus]|nr:hypothetical protein M3Y97_00416500 [Aphelenchoides bicaudatus]
MLQFASIASKTLWFGRLPTNCSEHDIRNSVKDSADPQRINIISSRACAYVTFPDRRSAYKIIDRLHRDIKVNGRNIKLEWATSSSIQKGDKIMDFWDKERGYFNIPHRSLPHDLAPLLESNHLDVATLPSHMKGKYTESGPIEKDETQEAIQNIQPPVEIPLPSSTQLPQGLLQFPPNISADGSTPTLPNFPPLGLPGFLQPNLLAVLAQQQQQAAPAFENLVFNALQQNPGAGILPNLGQAPNIFSNIPFDNNVTESQGSEPQPFQSKFNNARGNFQPRFRGGFRGNDRGSSFRPRFNNRGQNGEFRPRGRGRGDRSGEFRPHRGNFNNANFQPLPQFMPNNGIGLNIGNLPLAQSLIGAGITTSLQPPTNNELNESNDMEIDNQTENSLSA